MIWPGSMTAAAAVIYAAALAENRFRGAADRELVALTRRHLTAAELRAVEAVARMMALANLNASTLGRATRAGRRPGRPADAGAHTTAPAGWPVTGRNGHLLSRMAAPVRHHSPSRRIK